MNIELILSMSLVFIFGSVLISYVSFQFSFIFWGKASLHLKHKKKLIWLILIRSLITVPALLLAIPKVIISIFLIILTLILIFLFYVNKGMTYKDGLRFFVIGFIVNIFLEMSFTILVFQFISIEAFLLYDLRNTLIFIVPIFSIMTIGIYLINQYMIRNQIFVGELILNYIEETQKQKLSLLLTFTAVQFLAIFVLVVHFIFTEAWSWTGIIGIFIISIVSFGLIIISLKVIAQSKNEGIRSAQEVYIDGINQMFVSLRGQRHDFLNHVQVVSALAKSGKLHEAELYLDQTLEEVNKMSNMVQIGDPAICALIQLKVAYAESHHIDFDYQIPQYGSMELGAKSIDLVKILGNLIDNAFEEVMQMPEKDRWVVISGWIDEDNLYIQIKNALKTYVETEKAQSFFEAGTSSKEDNHSGLGLAIVKQKIKEYKGDITVHTIKETKEIQFELKFPMAKNISKQKTLHLKLDTKTDKLSLNKRYR
jgi:signal transduction histidine kinase